MTMKVLLIGGIAIASAMPANAQDLPRPEVPEQRAGPSGGIRIAEASNGSCPSMWCKFGCGQRAAFSGGLWCNL